MKKSPVLDRQLAETRIDGILSFLHGHQDDVGEFRAVRHFHGPVESYTQPSPYEGWFYFGRCPFITATVAYHLSRFRDPRAVDMHRRACSFLAGTFENGLVRYIPAQYQDIWFPTDVDDTCLVAKVLKDSGHPVRLDESAVLDNVDGRGGLFTWVMPRWRHLRSPRRYRWLRRDYRTWATRLLEQDSDNGNRLLTEYRTAREPAVLANVLLYFGRDRRVRRFVAPLMRFVLEEAPRLEYYDSLIGLHFHIGRLFAAGEASLAPLAPHCTEYIRARQEASGLVQTGFDTAMAALTLMYFGQWQDPTLLAAVDYLIHDPMHETTWSPSAYVNPVNRAFSDGAAGLTAVLYLDALRMYVDHVNVAAH